MDNLLNDLLEKFADVAFTEEQKSALKAAIVEKAQKLRGFSLPTARGEYAFATSDVEANLNLMKQEHEKFLSSHRTVLSQIVERTLGQ